MQTYDTSLFNFLCLSRFNAMWCPGPQQSWSNSICFRGASCRLPHTTMYHGILLCKYLQCRQKTRHSLISDVPYKYRHRQRTLLSKTSRSHHFHNVYYFYFMLDSLLCLHDLYDSAPNRDDRRCIHSELWTSLVLVRVFE